MATRPSELLAALPAALTDRPQWVLWRTELRDGKPTKVPIQALHPERRASSTDPSTWASFAEARAALDAGETDGVGFVFSADDPLAGVDFDKCRDPETGAVEPWAAAIVDRLDSYTEISPSGRGLHVIVEGAMPVGANRRGRVEMYSAGRFFTMTGHQLPGALATVEPRQAELEAVWREHVAPTAPPPMVPRSPGPVEADDEKLLERARAARNGDRFARLWTGDTADYASGSEADLALCDHLAFWTNNDAERIDHLFRASGLMRPKWDQLRGGQTYGASTIALAVGERTRGGANGASTAAATAAVQKPEVSPDATLRPARRALPVIRTTGEHLRDMSAASMAALEAANDPPRIFTRSAGLVRVQRDEQERPIIERLGEHHLRGHMARAASFVRVNKAEIEMPTAPPIEVVRDVLSVGGWGFPALEGIIEAPALRSDGTILVDRGYDPQTRSYHAPAASLRMPPVPETPSAGERAAARALLEELVCDFPFEDRASLANALGLLMTPVVRPAIRGLVPLAVVDATKPGTGKGLLANVASTITTGRPSATKTTPVNDEEWGKVLLATLREGATFVLFDEASELRSPALSAALTAAVYDGRVLGQTENVRVPNRATWIAAGNNIRLGGDIPRRCFWIRLDAKSSQPWKRTDFRHPRLLDWVAERRGEVLAAVLTLARAWFAAGRPAADVPTIGGFEEWASTVGGILAHAGVEGFLGNLDALYELVDEETASWFAFLTAWRERFEGRAVTVAELTEAIVSEPQLRDAVPPELAEALDKIDSFKKRLGRALAKRNGTRFGEDGLRVERGALEARRKVQTWRAGVGV